MSVAAPRVTKVYRDTIRKDFCRSSKCGRRIFWAQLKKSGRFMCFDQEPEALVTEIEMDTKREVMTVDATDHFATCPGARRER